MGTAPGLLPCELWDYGVVDAVRGVSAGLSARSTLGPIALEGIGDAVPVRAARVGIVLALRALKLGTGARVGVPLYCCPVVFKAIEAAGCVPRFVDVDPATCCISPDDLAEKRYQIDALIAVHMFGNVCDMPRLRAAAPGVPIIEDCAQSLGSALRGRQTGSFGDLAVFSFRAGKYLSVGQGGAVSTADPVLRARVLQLASDLPVPSRGDECAHVVKSFARARLRSRPLYGLVGQPLWRAYTRNAGYTSQSPLTMARIHRADLGLIGRRLPMLSSLIAARRAHADIYGGALADQPVTFCAEPEGAWYNRYQFPLLLRSAVARDAVSDYLLTAGVDASKPYSNIAEMAARHHGYEGDCLRSHAVAQRVLVVPNHERMTRAEVEHVARTIVEGLHRYQRSDDLSEADTTTHCGPAVTDYERTRST